MDTTHNKVANGGRINLGVDTDEETNGKGDAKSKTIALSGMDYRSTAELLQLPESDVRRDDADVRKSRRRGKLRVVKNVAVLSVAWLLLFIGITPITSMQSSLNARQGLGTLTMALGSATRLVTSLFLTNLLLAKLGVKRLICCGAMCMSAMMLANFYPVWATMAPGVVLAGIGNGVMWVGQNIYLSQTVKDYASLVDTPTRTINVRVFGTFYGIYYCNHVIGHVSSSFILGAGLNMAQPTSFHRNATLLGYDPVTTCGAQFCNQDMGTSMATGEGKQSSRRPTNERIYALCGFCLGSVLLGVLLLVLFLDPLDKPSADKADAAGDSHAAGDDVATKTEVDPELDPELEAVLSGKSAWVLLGETLMQLRNPKLLLLLPLFIYNGVDDSFLNTELTKAYITCAIGVEYIGFISALFGVFCPLSALVCGWLNSPRTRFLPFILMSSCHLSCMAGLLMWDLDTPVLYLFIISAVWGVGSGACGSQTSGIVNVFFADNLSPTYSNSTLWASVGGALFFGLSSVLCTYVKFYMLSAIIILAVVCVAVLEIVVHCQTRGQKK